MILAWKEARLAAKALGLDHDYVLTERLLRDIGQ